VAAKPEPVEFRASAELLSFLWGIRTLVEPEGGFSVVDTGNQVASSTTDLCVDRSFSPAALDRRPPTVISPVGTPGLAIGDADSDFFLGAKGSESLVWVYKIMCA
jgi:hypothetical protein